MEQINTSNDNPQAPSAYLINLEATCQKAIFSAKLEQDGFWSDQSISYIRKTGKIRGIQIWDLIFHILSTTQILAGAPFQRSHTCHKNWHYKCDKCYNLKSHMSHFTAKSCDKTATAEMGLQPKSGLVIVCRGSFANCNICCSLSRHSGQSWE